MILPTLEYEQKLWKSGIKYVAGVDEVGRGALAGPVVAAAVVFDPSHVPIEGVRDSKTLSKLQKSKLDQKIRQCCKSFAIGKASPLEIDNLGIVTATALAMSRALKKITDSSHVLIDGLPFKNQNLLKQRQKTFIVKGDSFSYSIAAASIIAKVHRDNLMVKLAKKHKKYSFEKNVGYGSNGHRLALIEYGVCTEHRLSFLTRLLSGQHMPCHHSKNPHNL
jgi:ribonuclease HII